MKRDQKAATTPLVDETLRSIGANLRRVRLSRRLSLAAAAARAGISAPTLMRIERGDPSVSIGAYTAALAVYQVIQAVRNALEHEAEKAMRMLAEVHAPTKVRRMARYDF